MAQKDVVFVIEYWFRIFLNNKILVSDISNIIKKFAKPHEEFNAFLCHKDLCIKNNGLILQKSKFTNNFCTCFGKVIAKKGKIYHWKIKFEEGSRDLKNDLNIGIVEKDKCKQCLDKTWWYLGFGYSYYSNDGKFYNMYGIKYGEPYGITDIIDIWLDLAINNSLSFAKNGKKYGCADKLNPSKQYRLAIGMYGTAKQVKILQSEEMYKM